MDYATTFDLANRWRPLTAEEETPAATLLGSASRLVRARVPDVDARIADESLDADTVTDVVCEMVRRALQTRFSGAQSVQVGVGAVSQQITPANPQANLYITSDELARLSATQARRAFSIPTLVCDASS